MTLSKLSAVSIAIVICSFSAGALAFAKEIVVEVPVEQETVTLEGTGLSMILPEQFEEKGYDFVAYRYLLSIKDSTYELLVQGAGRNLWNHFSAG